MEYIVIIIISLLASLLTFFSGFGLGTLLMPVFAIYFPVDIAIALIGLVHFANNLFKFGLIRKFIDWPTALHFGVPAMVAALAGAWLLSQLSRMPPLFTWHWDEKKFFITPINLIVSLLLLVFVLLEMSPRLQKLNFGRDKLLLGGLLSGFFGGLSGHQGALRSAFLMKAGLSKEGFVATGVIIACLIDVSRLLMYADRLSGLNKDEYAGMVAMGTLAAFAGAYAGSRLLKKVTMHQVQRFVSVMLILISLALGAGLI